MSSAQKHLSEFVRSIYQTNEFIPLHAPTFGELEKANVLGTIESTFVSSVGKFVDEFEQRMQHFTGAKRAVATVNGTAALHTALYMAGVQRDEYVITQALTFVATCNAIYHMGAEPIFLDVSKETLGLCPIALEQFLEGNAVIDGAICKHKASGRVIRAAVPMHTFGHPVHLDEIKKICDKWGIQLIEDAAESLGSYYKEQHTGTIGQLAALSFNGNKIITTGGGGMVLCADEALGQHTKHVTTTAKVPHPYEFFHDEPGFNYRLPNINAALGCAQMQQLPTFLEKKRKLAAQYREYFNGSQYEFVDEPAHGKSNFWLNAILCEDKQSRDELLEYQNAAGIMCRPIWQLMHRLPMFQSCIRDSLKVSEDIEARLINLPSSPA
ncbi:MAG: aminotransferase DegT [Alcanivorax sp.]|nr:MAG: aminotransferase DegT [Alcanivorax sp.]